MKCLNCGKPVKQTPGKRAKNYCDPNCRQKYWLKNNKKKSERGPGRPPKTIDPKKIQAKIKEVKESLKGRRVMYGPMQETFLKASEETEKAAIEAAIALIKSEKIPVQRDTPLGRKSWAVDQKKRIRELEERINTNGK